MTSEVSVLRVERASLTLRELALEKLRDAILNFHFKPGERLVERKLCDELGVSRTVVREVLRHLEAEGLVQVLPNRGPSVATIDLNTAQQIYQLRAVLESMAARQLAKAKNGPAVKQLEACLKLIERAYKEQNLREIIAQTQRFYSVIFLESGLTVAWEIVKNLNARISVLRAMTVTSSGRRVTGVNEMREMIKAIASGDADLAEVTCRAHVDRAHEIAKRRLTENLERSEPIDLWLDSPPTSARVQASGRRPETSKGGRGD